VKENITYKSMSWGNDPYKRREEEIDLINFAKHNNKGLFN
jgi:hypothetical protein